MTSAGIKRCKNRYNIGISTVIDDGLTPFGALQWRNNEYAGVSNHQCLDCLLNRLFRRTPKKTSKLRVTSLCEGNSAVNSRAKGQQRGKCFHLMTSSWLEQLAVGEVMIKLCFRFSYGTRTCRLRAHAVSSVYIQFPERNIPRAISQVDVIIHTSMPVGNRTLTVHYGLIKLIPCQYHYANREAWPFRSTYISIHFQLESII